MPLPQIVEQALTQTVTNIGQLSAQQVRTLNRYTKQGWLSRGKGGPYPVVKTMWAHPGFDFAGDRARRVSQMLRLAALDRDTSV